MITIAPKITDAGINLALRSLGGESITFTRFKLGNGDAVENSASLIDLVNPVMELAISEFDATSIVGAVKLTCNLDFAQIENDFKWSEIGIFCKGEDGNEVLFAYSNDAENAGFLRSEMDGVVGNIGLAFIIAMSTTENVSAVVSGLLLYATKKELEDHVNDKNNPHKVSAEDVGLGNVPNVSTEEQVPKYEYSSVLAELTSGEKLSFAFGKIAKAVREFILHLKASNPHNLKASDLKAADKEHSHSTADINSGILPYARGGTNVDTKEKLRKTIIDTMTYTGDGNGQRDLYLGYRPRAVLVVEKRGLFTVWENDHYVTYGGLALDGYTSSAPGGTYVYGDWFGRSAAVQIFNDGFRVRSGECENFPGDAYINEVQTNQINREYHVLIIL